MKSALSLLLILSLGNSTALASEKSKAKPVTKTVDRASSKPASRTYSEACQEKLKKADPSKDAAAVCSCLVRNLSLKIKPHEFGLLAKLYTGEPTTSTAEKKADRAAEADHLYEFEQDLAEECMENSKFKIGETKAFQ